MPEATGAQRSVIGVRFNIFEAKESDATIPPPKKKKKSVRSPLVVAKNAIVDQTICRLRVAVSAVPMLMPLSCAGQEKRTNPLGSD